MSPSPAPTAPRPPLRVALAGVGVVGGGVVRLLDTSRELIARRAGRSIEIVAIPARVRHKDRGADPSASLWADALGTIFPAYQVQGAVECLGHDRGQRAHT